MCRRGLLLGLRNRRAVVFRVYRSRASYDLMDRTKSGWNTADRARQVFLPNHASRRTHESPCANLQPIGSLGLPTKGPNRASRQARIPPLNRALGREPAPRSFQHQAAGRGIKSQIPCSVTARHVFIVLLRSFAKK